MRLTRRVFLEGAGSLAAALAACGGSGTDAGDEEVIEQEVEAAVVYRHGTVLLTREELFTFETSPVAP